jgi:hypothetical protein
MLCSAKKTHGSSLDGGNRAAGIRGADAGLKAADRTAVGSRRT